MIDLAKVLREAYNDTAKMFPSFIKVPAFPVPPIISYHWPKNLILLLIRADHRPKLKINDANVRTPSRSYLSKCMNNFACCIFSNILHLA